MPFLVFVDHQPLPWTLGVERRGCELVVRARGALRDLGVLLRHMSWARPVPGVRGLARHFVTEFDHVVLPLVARAGLDADGARSRAAAALRAAGVKLGFLATGFADMAGVPVRADLAVLTGAITRVYDDLFDRFAGADLGERLDLLFREGTFEPVNPVEALFAAIYTEIVSRVAREPDDPVFTALSVLHHYQVRSREQTVPDIDDATIERITRGKGGYGVVVLFDVATAPLDAVGSRLIHRLGALLQLLDDYQDVKDDAEAGIATAATRGGTTLDGICTSLRELRPHLRAHYGDPTPLYAVLYATLWMAFIHRRWGVIGARMPPPLRPMAILLRHSIPLDLDLSNRGNGETV